MYTIHVDTKKPTAYGDRRLYAMVQRLADAKAVAELAARTHKAVWVYEKGELVMALY